MFTPGLTLTDKPTKRPAKRTFEVPTLARTKGPDPATPLAEVMLSVGVIVGTHGLAGEMRVKLTTDDPEHLATMRSVLVGENLVSYTIESVRFHKGMALICFTEIDGVDQAESMRGQSVRISGADVPPLAPDEYYIYQVIGLEARLDDGTVIGKVTDVIETGANMVFVVSPGPGEKDELFPSIPDVVIDLKPSDGYMIVRRQQYWDE